MEIIRDSLDGESCRLFIEVIAVDLRHFYGTRRNPHLAVDHELGKAWTINENDALHGSCELDGLSRIARCCYEHTLVCALASQRAVERLHLWPTHSLLPPLGLNVYLLQPELI